LHGEKDKVKAVIEEESSDDDDAEAYETAPEEEGEEEEKGVRCPSFRRSISTPTKLPSSRSEGTIKHKLNSYRSRLSQKLHERKKPAEKEYAVLQKQFVDRPRAHFSSS
jgi:hypothetical protein